MSNTEQAVRDAALDFKTAIADAVAAGYRVNWPGRPEDLDKIEISSTRDVVEQPLPQQVFAPRRPNPEPSDTI